MVFFDEDLRSPLFVALLAVVQPLMRSATMQPNTTAIVRNVELDVMAEKTSLAGTCIRLETLAIGIYRNDLITDSTCRFCVSGTYYGFIDQI